MGGIDARAAGLERTRALGMKPLPGNAASSDIGCWVEACLARRLVTDGGDVPIASDVMAHHEEWLRKRAEKDAIPFGHDLAICGVHELSETLERL